MRSATRSLFLTTLIGALLFGAGFQPFVHAQEEKSFRFGLNVQSVTKGVIRKFTDAIPFSREGGYKEKYFKLLREFAELKLSEQETEAVRSLEALRTKYPNAIQAKTLKLGDFGLLYLESPARQASPGEAGGSEKVKEGAAVLDDHFLLIGRIQRVRPSAIEVRTLAYPGTELNIADADGGFLGIGKTTGLGYLEIPYLDAKAKRIGRDDLTTTFGQDKLFPSGFVFGRVVRTEKQGGAQRALIEPIGSFADDNYFIIP